MTPAAARITPITPATTDNTIPTGWEDIAAELPPFSTPEQLAELLAITTATLQDWRYKHTGPTPTKIGKRAIRYRRHDILTWLATQ